MAHLLYIESSPRKERSSSIAVSKVFLSEYQKAHPADTITTVDLWKTALPEFSNEVIDAKYALLHGQSHTPAQVTAWKQVELLIKQFTDADKYVISLPMWNFGIPYKLKHYIDLLIQPGYTFSFSPETGYKGLVTGKKMLTIYSRGGAYGAGTGGEALDIQKSYMETALSFIGFQNIESLIIEPTLSAPEVKEAVVKKAKEEAVLKAKSY
jgi:FMN-dependent NADH-azoreductase